MDKDSGKNLPKNLKTNEDFFIAFFFQVFANGRYLQIFKSKN